MGAMLERRNYGFQRSMLLAAVIVSFFLGLGMIENEEPIRELVLTGRSTVLFPPEVYEAASNPPNLGIDFDEDTELLLAHGLSPAARRSVEPPPSAPKLKVDVQPRQSNAPDSDDDDDYQEIVVSRGTVLGSMGSTGYMVKQHYRFENVQLSADGAALHFYYDPGFKMPMEHWVDTIFNNATSRELPTMTMMREGINGTYRYLKIDYLPAEEAQPTCTQWIEKPVYVVQLQHNENIWHVWTDGLMGAFQTLREQGLLPLAQVDADGRVAEYSEGVGDGCQWILDQETKKSSQEYPGLCRPRTGLVKQTRCDLEAEYWCKEGVVVVDPKNSPMLLMFNGTEILDKWEHMYYAISQDIRTWDEMNGTCFREIYLGKSNTLNFYMPLLQFFEVPEPEPLLLGYSTSLRSNATQAFKALIGTAEKVDYQARQVPGNPEYWESYPDPSMERLRVGIGPEDMDALDYLRPSAERARELGEMRDRELEVLERYWRDSAKLVQELLLDREEDETEEGDMRHKTSGTLEHPRPVVTYMYRDSFKRSVLNTHDVLTYLLSRYNVTLRVTTFEEPLLEVMDLLAHTDVLIGMHGAGWTNSLFIKRGAAALQMIPFGWTRPDGSTIRGSSYKSIVLASDCQYVEWANERRDMAFVRRHDIMMLHRKGELGDIRYSIHPDPEWDLPFDKRPGQHWINQNTFVDMESFAPVLDGLMQKAGIPVMRRPQQRA